MNKDLQQLKRDVTLAKNQEAVHKIHEKVLAEVKDVKAFVAEVRDHMKRITSLPRGPKGDKGDRGAPGLNARGKDGLTPTKGVDYWTDSDIEELIIMVLGRIKLPKDGKDAVLDPDVIAKQTAEYILEKKLLDVKHVKGLRQEIDSYRNQMAMKQAGQHGGGDVVVAGTNVTITTNSDGAKVINAIGGSSGIEILEPTGSVNSSNTEFAFSEEPTLIVNDGSTLRKNFGWTWDGVDTATMDSAPNFDLYGMV